MRELRTHAGQIIRILCLILAGLVVYQLAGIAIRWNPFRGVTVPELPSLTTAATNRPAESTHKTNLVVATASKGTNSPLGQPSTNATPPVATAATNSIPNTNLLASTTPAAKGTNLAAQAEASPPTNAVATTTTNAAARAIAQLEMEHASLNSIPPMLSTNAETNPVISAAATGTNNAAAKPNKHQPSGAALPAMAGMDFSPGQPPGKRGADLPPAMQSRIHQITESEILAPVMRPLPMALLGIAGEYAFLRSANGQTGLVKDGDSLDDLKLLRIGTNRVLIEQDGQKKELMIFDGYGGDSLLPKDSTNENNHL